MDSKFRTELVIKAITGDHDAFSELYSEYRDELIRFIIKQGAATREDAEDVVSEAFTEAFEHIGELREPEHFGTWLHSIARYCYLGTVKKERKLLRVIDEVDSEQSDDSDDIADDTVILPDDYAENEQIKQMLSETILSMKKEFQDVIFLYYYEDMSIKEIAERQSLSEGTVKSQLHYAKKTLRKKLEPIARKGGLFAAVPFGAMFNAIDLSGELSGAGTAVTVVTGGSAAVTGGSLGTAAVVSVGKAAGLITAAVLAGAVAVGVFFLQRMEQEGIKGEYTETRITTFSKETSIAERTVTTTTAASAKPAAATAPGSAATTRRSVTDSTTRRTRTTTQSTERPQTQPVQQETQPVQQETQPVQQETQPVQQGTQPVQQRTQPPATSDNTGNRPDPEIEGEKIVSSGDVGNKIKWTLDEDGVLTLSGSGRIPGFYYKRWNEADGDMYGDYAPWDSPDNDYIDSIKKIIIKNGVTDIGNNVLSGCKNLTSVTIPDSVTTLGNRVFSDCTSLTSVTIPNSVTSIGDEVFSGCTSLTSVTIPNSVTTLGNSVFSGCTSLTSVTLPDSVTSIGDWAFSGCDSLKSVTLKAGLKTIGDDAFSYCSSLTSITLPNSITYIGKGAFCGCESLIKATIPNSVTSIGNELFSGCSSLTSVTIPNSVTSIGDDAFSSCSSLTSVTIPNSVTSIGYNAFNGCSLTSVTIPDSVKSIRDRAFLDCTSLKSITVPESVTNIGEFSLGYIYGEFSEIVNPNFTLKCKAGSAAEKYAKENGITCKLIK